MTTREEKFYKKWEEQRKKKWLYIFLHGTVYWGLFMAISLFLWNSDFKVENMHIADLLVKIIVFGIGGIPIGILNFNQLDKKYLNRDIADILDGIKRLKAGKVWKYDNLIINNINNETLVVRNKLFWFDKSEDINEKANECFDAVLNDYQQINKEPKFQEFSKNYNVRIQIFEVLDNDTPLIDKAI
ncbi:hypothetical protein [uncultured Bacteroides sp.]|uniref:hypothetical protein n=1 Tax=uncultured Bacteroides sp. TaxID=162156 RepID=UPI002AAB9896|nr:hypothetical protein [uncultured Bacteroides sp.]